MAKMPHHMKLMLGLEFSWALACFTMLLHIPAQFMAKHKFHSGWCACAKLVCVSLNLLHKYTRCKSTRHMDQILVLAVLAILAALSVAAERNL